MSTIDGHVEATSPVLRSGDLARISPKFAEGFARIREVADTDGALPVWAKALYMAAAAAVKGHEDLMRRELQRSAEAGLTQAHARGACIAVLISRGEAVYARFAAAVDEILGAHEADVEPASFVATADDAVAYFERYFDFVPDYVDIMAKRAPRGLEGYYLMREAALEENPLPWKHVELLLITVNAAEFSSRFVGVHAGGARKAGASENEIVEAAVCAIPVAGVASWLPAADGIAAVER
jgi:alkylhydroperoxidase/carboxymuconolactone decarboxylase family protein YurZ